MRRLALVAVAGLVLAGCGGSSKSSTTNAFDGYPRTEIVRNYATFFAGSTPLAERVALLQNGSHFKQVIQGFASNPLSKNVSVKVTLVRPQGVNKAKVVYVVKLGGAALPKQSGTAVLQNGTWKVGYASLCKLVALQGSTPSVCKS